MTAGADVQPRPATPPSEPMGQALVRDALDRPMDLEGNLRRMQQNTAVVIRFVAQHLREAEYDEKGYLVPGKLHDYYQIPGTTNKALTKKGAENLALLFRYAKGSTSIASQTETKEYTSATVNVTLLDHYSRAVGSATGSCSTAEAGFQSWRARKKYGAQNKREGKGDYVEVSPPDYRAALNDVVARAGKRAFVQALIIATATDEVFQVVDDSKDTVAAPSQSAAVLPFKTKRYPKGTLLSKLPEADLKELYRWCGDRPEWASLKEDAGDALEVLRQSGPDADDLDGLAL